jgi:transcriptional regulator with PAS, ATPase and Fis domain
MKNIIVFSLLLMMLLMPIASADIVNDLENDVDEYNANVAAVPSYLVTLLGDEDIKLVIVDDDGDEVYIKAITEDAVITTFEEIDEDEDFDASMVVGANEFTVRSVLRASDPLSEFIAAKDNGEIVVEPVGVTSTVKYTVASVVMDVTSLFGF